MEVAKVATVGDALKILDKEYQDIRAGKITPAEARTLKRAHRARREQAAAQFGVTIPRRRR